MYGSIFKGLALVEESVENTMPHKSSERPQGMGSRRDRPLDGNFRAAIEDLVMQVPKIQILHSALTVP